MRILPRTSLALATSLIEMASIFASTVRPSRHASRGGLSMLTANPATWSVGHRGDSARRHSELLVGALVVEDFPENSVLVLGQPPILYAISGLANS
jgi:hypothetical protein